MMALARVPWGRSMLLRFYSLFSRGLVSHEGPTREQMVCWACCLGVRV